MQRERSMKRGKTFIVPYLHNRNKTLLDFIHDPSWKYLCTVTSFSELYFNIFSLVGDAGFGGAVVKRISEGREQNEFFSAFVALRVILLAASVSALLLARPLLVDMVTSGMFFWLLLALVIGVFSSSVGNGNYGSGKVGVHQTCGFLDVTGRIIFQVAAVFLGFGAAGLAGDFVFGMIAGGIVGLRFLDLRFARFGMHHLKSLFSFSFWILLAAGGGLMFSYADTVLIGYFMENADVGVYRVAALSIFPVKSLYP